ncbi:MAG: peptidylprolyl isomerase [Planctomycetota bacterium]
MRGGSIPGAVLGRAALAAPALAVLVLAVPGRAAAQEAGDGDPNRDPSGAPADVSSTQEAAPAPDGEDDGDDWDGQRLDGIAVVVGDGVITFGDIDTIYAAERERRDITTEADRALLLRRIVVDRTGALVQQVGGRTLEISGADLDARVGDWIAEKRERGSLEYGEELRRRGRDPLVELERTRREFLAELWRRREVGDPNGLGRPKVDTYVRPGVLRARYEAFAEAASTDVVEFSMVTVQGAAVGGVDEARDVAADLRRQILSGQVDFAEAASQLNIPDANPAGGGRFAPVALAELGQGPIGTFAAKAREGEISEPMPFGSRGAEVGPGDEIRGYRLIRLEQRTPGPPPPKFTDPGVQADLRERIEDFERRQLFERALDRVGARVYRWQHPMVDRLFEGG